VPSKSRSWTIIQIWLLLVNVENFSLFFVCASQEEDEKWVQDYCMQVGNAYVIVYSITDRSSFESASELRIQLRRIRQAENIPIILVGNKSDLVRSREVAVEGNVDSNDNDVII
jgi:GTPase SAR1 family protein